MKTGTVLVPTPPQAGHATPEDEINKSYPLGMVGKEARLAPTLLEWDHTTGMGSLLPDYQGLWTGQCWGQRQVSLRVTSVAWQEMSSARRQPTQG